MHALRRLLAQDQLLDLARLTIEFKTTTLPALLFLSAMNQDPDELEWGDRLHERRRRIMERELRDLQDSQPQSEVLSREQRRVAAAAAAQARLEARNTSSTDTGRRQQEYNGRPRGRARLPVLYDENGIHINSHRDLCDCLTPECPGCHFPCKGCGSKKCGKKCRCNRKWVYTQIVEQNPSDESTIVRTKPF